MLNPNLLIVLMPQTANNKSGHADQHNQAEGAVIASDLRQCVVGMQEGLACPHEFTGFTKTAGVIPGAHDDPLSGLQHSLADPAVMSCLDA